MINAVQVRGAAGRVFQGQAAAVLRDLLPEHPGDGARFAGGDQPHRSRAGGRFLLQVLVGAAQRAEEAEQEEKNRDNERQSHVARCCCRKCPLQPLPPAASCRTGARLRQPLGCRASRSTRGGGAQSLQPRQAGEYAAQEGAVVERADAARIEPGIMAGNRGGKRAAARIAWRGAHVGDCDM